MKTEEVVRLEVRFPPADEDIGRVVPIILLGSARTSEPSNLVSYLVGFGAFVVSLLVAYHFKVWPFWP